MRRKDAMGGDARPGATEEVGELPHHSGWHRPLLWSRRGATALVVASASVLAVGTTIGVEVSHALSGPAHPSTATPTSAPSVSAQGPSPSSPSTARGGSDTATTTPQNGAPTTPSLGGATPGHGAFNAVACTSKNSCVAVGADNLGQGVAASTSDGAATWEDHALPSGVKALTAITCDTSTHCVAVGEGAVLTTTDGGSNWSLHSPPPDTTLLGVTCLSGGVCLSTGVTPNPTGPYAGVILRSTDAGTSWSAVDLPGGTTGLGAVACPTTTRCIAVGATIMTTDDAGATWQERTVDGGMQALRSISCSSATVCVAVGPNAEGAVNPSVPGFAVITHDGGNSWQPVALPAATAAVDQVDCTNAGACLAGGSQLGGQHGAPLETTSDGGGSWTSTSPPNGVSQISGMACPVTDNCVMVGRSGAQAITASTGDGHSWAVQAVPES